MMSGSKVGDIMKGGQVVQTTASVLLVLHRSTGAM